MHQPLVVTRIGERAQVTVEKVRIGERAIGQLIVFLQLCSLSKMKKSWRGQRCQLNFILAADVDGELMRCVVHCRFGIPYSSLLLQSCHAYLWSVATLTFLEEVMFSSLRTWYVSCVLGEGPMDQGSAKPGVRLMQELLCTWTAPTWTVAWSLYYGNKHTILFSEYEYLSS